MNEFDRFISNFKWVMMIHYAYIVLGSDALYIGKELILEFCMVA